MAGRTNRRPFWETSDVDRKPPVLLFRPNQTRRSQNGTDAFLPSGAVEYRSDPGPSWPANSYSTMSGNGSSNTRGNITGNDRYNGRVTSLDTDHEIAAAFRFTHEGTPLPSLSILAATDPNLGQYIAYSPARHPASPPGPSRGHRLQSPFAPVYPPPTATVAPAELDAGARPTVSPPRTSGNATTDCHCLTCSDGTPAKCLQSQLARQSELLDTAWKEERARSGLFWQRVESILREETRITVDHYRDLWDAERTQLKAENDYLSEQLKRLGDENLVLRGKLADQVQAGEPIIYEGSFRGNTPLVDGSPPSPVVPSPLSPIVGSPLSPVGGSPPSPVARRQSGGAGSSDSARDNRRISGLPGCYAHLFGLGLPASPQVPTPRNPSPPGTAVSPPPASAPQTLPSARISMSPQPGHDTIPISPTFSPFLPSSPYPDAGAASGGVSTPVRSPKRPLSVIDVHELDPKLEGISLRANAVRRSTFEEAPPDGSPPSKRRRSLSHDYYIVTNVQGEDEVTDTKKIEDEEDEERRLTMHAGSTPPPYSPSLPSEILRLRSQNSATPTASSFLPERYDSLETEDRSVTATAKEEVGESSGVSYSDLSNHLGRADSPGVLSAASGDAPLKGPLMIKNIPAQDELFLAALNERLEPISQGQDALPRAVQTPVAVPASLSAVHGEPFDGADASQTTAPDNTDISGTQSEIDGELDGAHEKMDQPVFPWPIPSNSGQKSDVHAQPRRPAYRIKYPDHPGYGYDGTAIKAEPTDYPFTYEYDTEVEAAPTVPVKAEDSDDDSDGRNSEPEVSIKFKSTSNFGAPFGRR
ncbi:hypothetical protein T069G_01616 [Trichoderma breve]|uniref:Uncharacterized protein n=1 Tax=Trichoderma breve TaxID=2034170 RepID=A0A9W9EEG2_9HYPO|nr:hypothetical protein T069G_01616 [Trichoderma breve]KAJ4865086.1 hypothetical protein T069G_01616 [Trichoderma breve]